ncbi:MAG TPA: hypothetical protein VFA39_21210 [Steroidobacteraceae bacterium]|nr:hypothetical protein [Steroidobacteraceae bacterium]
MSERMPSVEANTCGALVSRYLEAMQTADLEGVRAVTEPGARLEYPGPVAFTDPAEVLSWASGRHQWVRHTVERCDVVPEQAETVAYAVGTLRGVWKNGSPFSDVRFIYQFRIRGTNIVEARLWSDVAEVLRRAATTK